MSFFRSNEAPPAGTPAVRRRCRPLAALVLLLPMVACGGPDRPVVDSASFPPLHYEFLTPLDLNVATIDVEDQSGHPDGDLAAQSPASPVQAMQQMGHDRLVASGGSGTATFAVTQASITRNDDGGLTERLTAHLDVSGGSNGHTGTAEAHVSRSVSTPDGAGPAVLYDLTRQAMQDMNVEFEYQVRHSLADWLVPSGGGATGSVQQAPLTAGDPGASPGAPVSGAPLQLAPPAPAPAGGPGIPTQGATPLAPPLPDSTGGATPLLPPQGVAPDATAPVAPQLSPPPGYLVPPPGTSSGFVPPAYGAPVAPIPNGY